VPEKSKFPQKWISLFRQAHARIEQRRAKFDSIGPNLVPGAQKIGHRDASDNPAGRSWSLIRSN
jgi:hypothetical protein